LGIDILEKMLASVNKRLRAVEEKLSNQTDAWQADSARILSLLSKPMTTKQLASALDKHRSWVSQIVNELERQGKVAEVGKKGRELLYGKAD